MRSHPTKSNRRAKKGFTLIEIVVAIGISIVTITSSAVFSARLVRRAQQNFIEGSILQLQNSVYEQMRTLEGALQKDKNAGKKTNTATSETYLATAGVWASLCDNAVSGNTSAKYFQVALPQFNGTTPEYIQLTEIPVLNPVIQDPGEPFRFGTVTGDITNFGGLDNTNVQMSIKRTYETNAQTGNYLKFKIGFGYTLYNKSYYTNPFETRMIYDLVCPS